MDRKGGVIRLDHGIGYLRRWYHRERGHYPVGIFFADLGDQKCAHTGTGTTAQRMSQLETLQAVATLRFLSHHVEHRVHQFRALRVMSFRPIVARSGLTEHEIVRSKDVSERARPHRVHRTGFQIDKNRARYVLPTGRFVVVHVDPFQLQVRVSVIDAARIDAMLVRDHLPELIFAKALSSAKTESRTRTRARTRKVSRQLFSR